VRTRMQGVVEAGGERPSAIRLDRKNSLHERTMLMN